MLTRPHGRSEKVGPHGLREATEALSWQASRFAGSDQVGAGTSPDHPLGPIVRQSVAEAVAARLRTAILQGHIQPGARLPAERELARDLGTNRNTLREALRTLEAMGLVRARQGDGVIVLDHRNHGELHLLPAFLVEGNPKERGPVLRDLLGLRRVLLVHMAGLAAERAQPDDVVLLRSRLDTLKEILAAPDRPERLLEADLEFYSAVAAATRSLVARWSFNTFARAYLDIARALPCLWVTLASYLETLGELVSAIEAHNSENAQQILRQHFERVDALLEPVLASWAP